MSELSSLYVRLKMKKENLERFFQDKPITAEVDQDWASWWESLKSIAHYMEQAKKALR